MAEMRMKELTLPGECATHGSVTATKQVPAFTPPGLFWLFRYLGSRSEPYRCPECGAQVRPA